VVDVDHQHRDLALFTQRVLPHLQRRIGAALGHGATRWRRRNWESRRDSIVGLASDCHVSNRRLRESPARRAALAQARNEKRASDVCSQ
jgi:hypothetical protein